MFLLFLNFLIKVVLQLKSHSYLKVTRINISVRFFILNIKIIIFLCVCVCLLESDSRITKEITLFGKKYRIFSQSILCYGLDQALLMYHAHELKVSLLKLSFI